MSIGLVGSVAAPAADKDCADCDAGSTVAGPVAEAGVDTRTCGAASLADVSGAEADTGRSLRTP
jgi:hypothetical protein